MVISVIEVEYVKTRVVLQEARVGVVTGSSEAFLYTRLKAAETPGSIHYLPLEPHGLKALLALLVSTSFQFICSMAKRLENSHRYHTMAMEYSHGAFRG